MTIAPEGRKLLRIEARNAAVPIEKKPEWIKTRAKMGPEYTALRSLVVREGLHTVCQEAACPNIFECWEDKEATFLIGGERCTRRCDFCNIDTGKPLPVDRDEPRRVGESVKTMGLRYATITGVTRDDLYKSSQMTSLCFLLDMRLDIAFGNTSYAAVIVAAMFGTWPATM